MVRPTIPELVARYQLEPTIRDVFVEGIFDKSIFAWFLQRAGHFDARVFEVDLVDIPPGLVAANGFTDGNRQRVLTLAAELEKAATLWGTLQATCIVDADADHLLDVRWNSRIAFTTDFSCIEMYLFDEVHLGKFFQLTLELTDIDVRGLAEEYAEILIELFLIRAAALRLGLAIRFLDFTGCCGRDGKNLTLDVAQLIGRLLDASRLRSREDELIGEIATLRTRIQGDSRHFINGEDFVRLLEWDRKENLRRKELRNCEAVSAALRGCLEFDELSKHRLFQTLLQRML